MSQESSEICLGVDGGGTSSRFALLVGAQRFDHTSGPVNVTSDFEAGIANLLEGLAAVTAKAGITPEHLAAERAFLGLAGVVGPKGADAVAARLPLGNLRIDSDRVAALAGALGRLDGTLAGIGTGSFVIRQVAGKTRALGGWGLALGDEASGAWLGRELLALTLRANDGLADHSDLTRSILEEFGANPGAIAAFGAHADAATFATRAAKIAEAAEGGDANALALMQRGAAWIEAGARALGWKPGEALCLAGGAGPSYRPYLSAEARAFVVPPQGRAIDGALAIAQAMNAPRP